VLALSLALLLRLAFLFVTAGSPLRSDPLEYYSMARQLMAGLPFEPYWPPGLPLFLSPFLALFGTSMLVARVAMLVPYLAFAWLLHRMLASWGSRRAANLSLFVFAVFPNFILHSLTPLTQLPVAFLLLAATWLGLRVLRSPAMGPGLLWGIVLGVLPLFRPAAAPLVLVLPALVYLKSRRPGVPLLSIAVAAAILGVWLIKAHDLSGRFVAINSANARNHYLGNNEWTPLYRTWWFGSHRQEEEGVPTAFIERRDELEALPPEVREGAYRAEAWSHIKSHPGLFVLRSVNRCCAFFAFDTFTGSYLRRHSTLQSPLLLGGLLALDAVLSVALLGFGWLGLVSLRGRGDLGQLSGTAWLVGGLYALPYFFSFSHPTYHFPILPLVAISALLYVDRLWSRSEVPGGPPIRQALRQAIAWRGGNGAAAGLGLIVLALIQVEWVIINVLAR
jgi:4-amino-4-deoxy-L-arabinose transferase-like glycosyltransferase